MNYAVGVVGLGKLGTPLALLIAEAGHFVQGVDLDEKRVADLKAMKVQDSEPGVKELLNDSKLNIKFSVDFDSLADTEIIYIIVPTPSLENGYFSNDYVKQALIQIGKSISSSLLEQLIVVVSTVMPGSTNGELRKALDSALPIDLQDKKKIIYSPEFIALGSVVQNLQYPDLILVGADNPQDCQPHLQICTSISKNSPDIKILNIEEAELVKLAINTFITMKITFANFIGEIARKSSKVSADEVCRAIGGDSRIGAKYLSPGLGFGGPCFPRDNRAFSEYGKSLQLSADLAIATEQINKRLPRNIAQWIAENHPKDTKLAILGITYKENTEVTEESQAISLANELNTLGFRVFVHDPLLTVKPKTLREEIKFSNDFNEIFECDVALRTTNWPPYLEISQDSIKLLSLK
jgi:UDPglucose 6-dehydrogenase